MSNEYDCREEGEIDYQEEEEEALNKPDDKDLKKKSRNLSLKSRKDQYEKTNSIDQQKKRRSSSIISISPRGSFSGSPFGSPRRSPPGSPSGSPSRSPRRSPFGSPSGSPSRSPTNSSRRSSISSQTRSSSNSSSGSSSRASSLSPKPKKKLPSTKKKSKRLKSSSSSSSTSRSRSPVEKKKRRLTSSSVKKRRKQKSLKTASSKPTTSKLNSVLPQTLCDTTSCTDDTITETLSSCQNNEESKDARETLNKLRTKQLNHLPSTQTNNGFYHNQHQPYGTNNNNSKMFQVPKKPMHPKPASVFFELKDVQAFENQLTRPPNAIYPNVIDEFYQDILVAVKENAFTRVEFEEFVDCIKKNYRNAMTRKYREETVVTATPYELVYDPKAFNEYVDKFRPGYDNFAFFKDWVSNNLVLQLEYLDFLGFSTASFVDQIKHRFTSSTPKTFKMTIQNIIKNLEKTESFDVAKKWNCWELLLSPFFVRRFKHFKSY